MQGLEVLTWESHSHVSESVFAAKMRLDEIIQGGRRRREELQQLNPGALQGACACLGKSIQWRKKRIQEE